MVNSSFVRLVGPPAALLVAVVTFVTTGADAPAVTAHLDSVPPGVVLGTRPTTQQLQAAAAVKEFPGKSARKAAAAGKKVTGAVVTAVADGPVPAGIPGVPALASHLAPSCTGTGTDGNRVQVVYAVESGKTDRYSTLATQLQSWIADVDDTVGVSAAKTLGGRRVRWVHSNCIPVIKKEILPAGSLSGGFSSTVSALKARGYTSAARKYLVFADDAALCGVGQKYADSKKTGNANDGAYTMFARVDSPCWPFTAGWHSTAAHELLHTLGAVQNNAPHSTKAGHCNDETDAMCYADGGTASTMVNLCAGVEDLLDCREDDYFHSKPPAGSYLAQYWNPADSSFLDVTASLTAAPKVTISGSASVYAGLSRTYSATSNALDTSYRWSAEPAKCLPGGRSSASVVLSCPATTTGSVLLTLYGSRPGSATGRTSLKVTLPASPKLTMTTTLRSSVTTVAAGGSATLTGKVTYGTAPVRVALTLWEKNTNGTFKTLASSQDTGADGVHAFTVKPTRTTTYVVKASTVTTGGWNPPTQATTTVKLG